MKDAAKTFGQGVQGLGTFAIWKNIIGGVVAALILSLVTVAAANYHRSWKLKTCAVTSVECDPPQTTRTCDAHNNCTTGEVQRCTVHLKGCHSISSTFSGSHPDAGDEVKVYYNPADESQSMLASQDFIDAHKPWILLSLICIIILVLASAAVQYAFRTNKFLQTAEGAMEGVSMLKSM